jgi:Fungal protein kinase
LQRIIMDQHIASELKHQPVAPGLELSLFPDASFPKKWTPSKLLAKLPVTVYQPARGRGRGPAHWVQFPDLFDGSQSSEEKIATFLNSIIAQLRKSLNQPQLRSWSSHFRDIPLTGSEMKRKPDLVLLDIAKNRVQKGGFRIGWGDARALGEVKITGNNIAPSHWASCGMDLANKALCSFEAQNNRKFVLGISICNSMFRLSLYDRGGAVHSERFDIHKSPATLIRIIYGLAFTPEVDIGYDESITRNPVTNSLHITVDSQIYNVVDRSFMTKALRGRGTICWIAECDGEKYLIKDSWADATRQHSEADILKMIQGIEGVPKLVHSEVDADYSTALHRSRVRDTDFDLRKRYRLVMQPVGIPIHQFSSKKELLSAIIDAVRGMK